MPEVTRRISEIQNCGVCHDTGVFVGYLVDTAGVRTEHFNKPCPAHCPTGLRAQARLDRGEPVEAPTLEVHGPPVDLRAKIGELRASMPDWKQRIAAMRAYRRTRAIAYRKRALRDEQGLPVQAIPPLAAMARSLLCFCDAPIWRYPDGTVFDRSEGTPHICGRRTQTAAPELPSFRNAKGPTIRPQHPQQPPQHVAQQPQSDFGVVDLDK